MMPGGTTSTAPLDESGTWAEIALDEAEAEFARSAHWCAVVRLQDEGLPEAQGAIGSALGRQGREMAEAVIDGETPVLDGEFMATAIEEVYLREVPVFARMTFERVEEKHPIRASVITYLVGDPIRQVDAQMTSEWKASILNHLATDGAARVTLITDTSRKWLGTFLSKAADEGWGPIKAARELRREWEGLTPARAERIARTELVSASNMGSQLGAESAAEKLGLTMKKSWLASRDGLVRDSHAFADGQQVGLDEAFSVGGEALRYPGDPAGSGGNVINCRCTVTFQVI